MKKLNLLTLSNLNPKKKITDNIAESNNKWEDIVESKTVFTFLQHYNK